MELALCIELTIYSELCTLYGELKIGFIDFLLGNICRVENDLRAPGVFIKTGQF